MATGWYCVGMFQTDFAHSIPVLAHTRYFVTLFQTDKRLGKAHGAQSLHVLVGEDGLEREVEALQRPGATTALPVWNIISRVWNIISETHPAAECATRSVPCGCPVSSTMATACCSSAQSMPANHIRSSCSAVS